MRANLKTARNAMQADEVLKRHGFEFVPELDEDADLDLESEYEFYEEYRGWRIGDCDGLTLHTPDDRVFTNYATVGELEEAELIAIAKDVIDEAIAHQEAASGQLDLLGEVRS